MTLPKEAEPNGSRPTMKMTCLKNADANENVKLEARLQCLTRNGEAPRLTAGLWDRLVTELKWFLGALANVLEIPGKVRPMRRYDHLTGTAVEVRVMELYTVISINGNDFYFKRLTGKYDGSGRSI